MRRRRMSPEELEGLARSVQGVNSPASVELAVACEQLAETESGRPEVADAARALHNEWALLVARATPAPIHAQQADAIDAQARGLAVRMCEFLKSNG